MTRAQRLLMTAVSRAALKRSGSYPGRAAFALIALSNYFSNLTSPESTGRVLDKIGNYIHDSRADHSGGGFNPTTILPWSSLALFTAYSIGPSSTPANASAIAPSAVSTILMPYTISELAVRSRISYVMPEFWIATAISTANAHASASLSRKRIREGMRSFTDANAVVSLSLCFFDNRRLASFVSSSTRAKSAVAARSLAIAMRSSRYPFANSTSRTRSFDRLVNSPWRRAPILANWTSAPTPSATSIVAKTVPQRPAMLVWSGAHAVRITSAIKPAMSNIAPRQPHDSHALSDASNSSLLAFFTPFGRRQSGNIFPRFWWGVAGSVVGFFAILWLANWLAQ